MLFTIVISVFGSIFLLLAVLKLIACCSKRCKKTNEEGERKEEKLKSPQKAKSNGTLKITKNNSSSEIYNPVGTSVVFLNNSATVNKDGKKDIAVDSSEGHESETLRNNYQTESASEREDSRNEGTESDIFRRNDNRSEFASGREDSRTADSVFNASGANGSNNDGMFNNGENYNIEDSRTSSEVGGYQNDNFDVQQGHFNNSMEDGLLTVPMGELGYSPDQIMEMREIETHQQVIPSLEVLKESFEFALSAANDALAVVYQKQAENDPDLPMFAEDYRDVIEELNEIQQKMFLYHGYTVPT